MDIWRSVAKKLFGLNIRKIGEGFDRNQSRRSREDRQGSQHGTGISVATSITESDINQAVRLLVDARMVHAKDPLSGHRVADTVLLELINNPKITEAFKECC